MFIMVDLNNCCMWQMFLLSMFVSNLCQTKHNKTVLDGFTGKVKKSKYKPKLSKIDQWREFYNNFIQKWLDENVSMYSTYNEGKSVVG